MTLHAPHVLLPNCLALASVPDQIRFLLARARHAWPRTSDPSPRVQQWHVKFGYACPQRIVELTVPHASPHAAERERERGELSVVGNEQIVGHSRATGSRCLLQEASLLGLASACGAAERLDTEREKKSDPHAAAVPRCGQGRGAEGASPARPQQAAAHGS